MLELIKTLKDTPVPTILTVAGIVFLLLGIAGGIVGKIQVARERQRISLAVGIVLLVLGIAIYVLPKVEIDGPNGGKQVEIDGPNGGKQVLIECHPEPVSGDPHGRAVRLHVRTHTQQNDPIAGAEVTIEPGRPWMNPSGAPVAIGKTDDNGLFVTFWESVDRDAAGMMRVTVRAKGFVERSSECGIPPRPALPSARPKL